MYKILITILFVFSCASVALAQDKYHKLEVSGGYSIMQADGIVGDGDMFTDKPDDPLTLNQNFVSAFPPSTFGTNNFTTANLFPAIPFSFSGKRHRAKLNGFNASATYNLSKYIGVKFEMSGNYRSNEVQGGTISLSVICVPPTGSGACFAIPIQSSYPAGTYRGNLVYGDFVSKTSQKHSNYLGGLQIKNNSKEKKIKPFAHVMAGVSQQTVKFKDLDDRYLKIFGRDKLTNKGFTMEFGGGLDIRLSKRLDLRVVQFDYNPVKIKEQQILAFQQPLTGINFPNNLTFLNTADPNFTQYSTADIKVRSRWQNNFRIGFGIVFH